MNQIFEAYQGGSWEKVHMSAWIAVWTVSWNAGRPKVGVQEEGRPPPGLRSPAVWAKQPSSPCLGPGGSKLAILTTLLQHHLHWALPCSSRGRPPDLYPHLHPSAFPETPVGLGGSSSWGWSSMIVCTHELARSPVLGRGLGCRVSGVNGRCDGIVFAVVDVQGPG